MSHGFAEIGDVIQFTLPDGRFAYGRVLRDASIAFYSETTTQPNMPSTGSRDYQFVVGVYADALNSAALSVVGHDPSQAPEDDWPPPYCFRDPISGAMRIYHRGRMRAATPQECEGLEPAAVWDLNHLIDRLMGL